ncbi:MAG: hypothetical protein ABI443_00295 [Chthoniobacterales bacterium]
MKTIPGYLSKLPGYTGIQDVAKVGMSVDQCAALIGRFAAIKKRTAIIAAAHMTGAAEWELKAALGRWLWEDATTYSRLEKRVTEMRASKASIDKVLDYQLGDLLTEILHAPGPLELCVGFFEVLSPAFCAAIKTYMERTQPLVDQPTIRLMKPILAEEEERLITGRAFVEALSQMDNGAKIREDWKNHFQSFLHAAGGILGDEPVTKPSTPLKPRAAEDEFRLSREFLRDARFETTITKSPPEFTKDALYDNMWGRSQEMTAAELMASVVYEWEDLPTDAFVDLARHCWDEVRHSLMGCAALEAAGIPINSFPSWIGYAHHTMNVPPPKRYAHLALATEAKLMAYPGGKRGAWEYLRDVAKHPLTTTFADFDWADEVNHVGFGRKWLIEWHFKGNREEARKVADETTAEREAYYAQLDKKPGESLSSSTSY